MPNTESEVIQIILKRGGKAKKSDVVKELGISLGYLDIITRSLERRELVKFSNNVYFLTSSGKKKLAEFIQKKVRKLKAKPSSRVQVEGKKRGRPKKQKTEIELTGQVEEPKEPPVETLLGQRIDELKEGVVEAEKKIDEGIKNIEEKIEKEFEKKLEIVEEKAKPAVKKVEELPPIILQFGKFLFSTGKKVFDKSKKRNFKIQGKLTSIPLWIMKNYKNFTKKRS